MAEGRELPQALTREVSGGMDWATTALAGRVLPPDQPHRHHRIGRLTAANLPATPLFAVVRDLLPAQKSWGKSPPEVPDRS